MNWQWHSVRWCKSGSSGWCWDICPILQVFQNFPMFHFYIKNQKIKACEVKSHSATFDNFPWMCWKHISGRSPYGGWFRFCFWSESSLICSSYQACARYTSGGTLRILYISEVDQTEIREPASFVGRNKHFQKITFSICLIFFCGVWSLQWFSGACFVALLRKLVFQISWVSWKPLFWLWFEWVHTQEFCTEG